MNYCLVPPWIAASLCLHCSPTVMSIGRFSHSYRAQSLWTLWKFMDLQIVGERRVQGHGYGAYLNFFFFLTTLLSHLDFSHGKFGLLFLGKASELKLHPQSTLLTSDYSNVHQGCKFWWIVTEVKNSVLSTCLFKCYISKKLHWPLESAMRTGASPAGWPNFMVGEDDDEGVSGSLSLWLEFYCFSSPFPSNKKENNLLAYAMHWLLRLEKRREKTNHPVKK